MIDFLEGATLLVDKPIGWTSFDVVKKIRGVLRKITGQKRIKVGHAGTLDPLASGLLIVCTGKKTKTIDEIQQQRKEYTGTIYLGARTPSFDLETIPENFKSIDHLTNDDLESTRQTFLGKIAQKPPLYSAIKIDGKRAYHLAREGIEAVIKAKEVELYDFEFLATRLPEIDFRIECSKGTYIRSIANDFGDKLAVGAYLKSLRRTKIGDFNVANSQDIQSIEEYLMREAQV
tara:strand:+ start:2061 stop:2756 length:696 start_codon:yes stop_codon:yes gene_type:complete